MPAPGIQHLTRQYDTAVQAQDYIRAREILLELRSRPRVPEWVEVRLAYVEEALGEHENALARLDTLLPQETDVWVLMEGWKLKGILHQAQGAPHMALHCWETAYRIAVYPSRPDSDEPAYNYACGLALTGQAEAALWHLKLAVLAQRHVPGTARRDPDFDSLRGHPGWKAALNMRVSHLEVEQVLGLLRSEILWERCLGLDILRQHHPALRAVTPAVLQDLMETLRRDPGTHTQILLGLVCEGLLRKKQPGMEQALAALLHTLLQPPAPGAPPPDPEFINGLEDALRLCKSQHTALLDSLLHLMAHLALTHPAQAADTLYQLASSAAMLCFESPALEPQRLRGLLVCLAHPGLDYWRSPETLHQIYHHLGMDAQPGLLRVYDRLAEPLRQPRCTRAQRESWQHYLTALLDAGMGITQVVAHIAASGIPAAEIRTALDARAAKEKRYPELYFMRTGPRLLLQALQPQG